jgi:sugar phosphate isomerase/epimerase
MSKLPVGVQVYNVREFAQDDFKGSIQKLKDIGYDFVELAGLYGKSAAEIKSALDEVGIPAYSAHVPIMELMADMEKTVADYIEIGCKFIVIPYLPEELRPASGKFDEVLQFIDKLGAYCTSQGVTLLYHNHDFEFVKVEDGRFALDYLYETISADKLQTEIDTCWVNVAGVNPLSYVEKYKGRAPVVHLKDFYFEGEKPNRMYALIGQADENEPASSVFELRPVGYGVQNMPGILAASLRADAQYVVVEQDQSIGRTPFEAAALSRNYLKELGW